MTDVPIERQALALFERLLDVAEGERDAWLAAEAGDRPDLLARVNAMRAADRSERMRTGAAVEDMDEGEDEDPPERIGAYRIVERIGRGGMGSVYLGERATGDFTHVVAIKIIKPGLLSEALVERFQRERQTLANLIHPNIARLYDGGETGDGSPFIVMEFVDGLPLLQWVEEHGIGRAGRQRLFLDICGAVAAAHGSLIVHRDLTPSNVLVTRKGLVKLIDFGIAREAEEGDGDGGTSRRGTTASLSLTPGYAAPERFTGAAVTTAADIYSLGKLLEKLIPPGPADDEVKAIVAQATRQDPKDRYSTVEALAADVAAWRDGMPVAAVRGGRLYTVRKFVGRHRIATAASAFGVLLLIGALALALVANFRAQSARQEAEQRFDQTRAIARVLLFAAYDEVNRIPGSTRARAMLAQTGLRYLDALNASADAPIDVQVDIANGYVRLAQVMGAAGSAGLGRFGDANILLGRAQAIAGRLAATAPDAPGVREMRANVLAEQAGTNLYNNNDPALARRQAQEAQSLLRNVATANVGNARTYAAAIQAEGDSHLWDEHYPQGRDVHLRGEAFIAGLPETMRRQREIAVVRAANLRLLGEAYHRVPDPVAARQALDRAVAINEALAAQWPGDPGLQRALFVALRYRAVVHRSNGRDALARESIDAAVAIARIMVERDRNDAGALRLLALGREVQAQVLSDLRQFPAAYEAVEEGITVQRQLVALAENAPGALRSMAQSMRTGGTAYYYGGDYANACRIWRAARDIFADLERRGSLTEVDRTRGYPEMRDYIRRSCEPPHAGLGPNP